MELSIVVLQTGFAVVLLIVVWASFSLLQHAIADTLIARIVEQAQSNEPLSAESANQILQSMEAVRIPSLVAILSTIVLTTALFGYALARFALIPTRNALRSQKQFVGNIAHELRTPLSVIKTNTEVALLDEPGEEAGRVFKSTLEELDRISNIINNLLSLSAFTRPERIEFSNVDMCAVVDESLATLSALAERKKHRITVRKAEPGTVRGNAGALEQITTNLIKNALNYTPSGGDVTVTVAPEGTMVRFSVEDSGVGINEKDLNRIFEPFYRAEASRSRATGSAGLGLAIVQELVQLHRGDIRFESEVGRGTTATVLLPAGKKVRKRA